MTKENELYQIGEVATESGASIDTIRYYEKLKLLVEPARSDGGFRKYPRKAIDQLRFIKKAQSFGLTLSEIRQIMRESERGLDRCCSHVEKLLSRKTSELEIKIKELRKMQKGLRGLMEGWIPLKEAKKKSFAVCPQIEVQKTNSKRRKRHVKKKS